MNWDDKAKMWALTLVVGGLGWLVKDFVFGILAKRDEAARAEWKEMLTGTWCPLYYWFGVVNYNDGQAKWAGHGVAEFEQLLAKAAHLLPTSHYQTLVRVLEHRVGLESAPPDMADIGASHKFIYGKIEALNYLLYRRPAGYDPAAATDVLSGVKTAFRYLSIFVLHVFVWAMIVFVFVASYFAYVRRLYWPIVVCGVPLGIAILVDWCRRIKLHRELMSRLRGPTEPARGPRQTGSKRKD
jgi:hypothetical protein